MQDVAKLAKVSVGSVSRVLNGRTNVAPGIQDSVRAAMALLNFVPNSIARSMRQGNSKAIGCLISDITQRTAAQMVSAAEERLRERGYEILVANSHFDIDRERGILSSLKSRRIDGFIGAISDDEDASYYNILHSLQMPIVLWERDAHGEFNSVLTDHADGCRQAINHLLKLGHRRIALITGRENTWVGREMVRGYVDAFDTAGIEQDLTLVFRTNHFSHQVCLDVLKRESPPTAFVAVVNDVKTVLSAVDEVGLSVPSQLSVISIGDHEFAPMMSPALTVVTQNPRDVGRNAANIMLQMLEGPAPSGLCRIMLPMSLIERKSCGPAPSKNSQ
ncbi:HTH-type transcriptional repressor PurR [compost metagenome]